MKLMEQNPDLEWIFVASQTVQYEWLKEDHPDLFSDLSELISISNPSVSNGIVTGVKRWNSMLSSCSIHFDINKYYHY